MTTSTEADIRTSLERIAGVQPSPHWLQDCMTELSVTGAANCTADAVLQQILHHDLRDVVRVFDQQQPAPNPQHPAVVLRRAVQASLQAPYKQQLPTDFRLLVQIEELLDISVNAETRLSVGPASPNAPSATGNQSNRCLKLGCSDGYCRGGSPVVAANENDRFTAEQPGSLFIAMEVEPIPALSVNSKAGTKVLLQGPLLVRHGVLLWQPVVDNTNNAAAAIVTVLGGSVKELVELQTQALQQAKLVAGVGVDPTIRALIWNPETGEMQEDDEREHESRDLEPGAPPPPVQPPVQQRQVAAAAPPQPGRPLRPVGPNTATFNPPPRQQQHTQQPARAPAPVPPRPAPPVARRPQPAGAASSARNPYASSGGSGSSNPYQSAGSSSSSNPYQSSSGGGSGSSNPYQNRGPATARQPVPRQPPSTATITTDVEDVVMADAPSARTQSALANRATAPSRPATAMAAAALASHSVTGTVGGIPISLEELCTRLARARESEALYRSMFGQVFVVRARQKGVKQGFNIEKVKTPGEGEGKKKVKKYGYFMSARFQDASGQGELITCKISNDILEPFFSLPPSEMRKLSREDRKKSEELTRNGGKHVQEALFQPRSYEMTLLLSPDEFFRSATNPMPTLDGPNPVLHLLQHCD